MPRHIICARKRRFLWLTLLALIWVFGFGPGSRAVAQDKKRTLRLGGIGPTGVRSTATERWITIEFSVSNFTEQDRLARVVAYYPEKPDVQYGREVWVPAESTVKSWFLIGPKPPSQRGGVGFNAKLYDRTDGKDELVLMADGKRFFDRGLPARTYKPSTALMVDSLPSLEFPHGALPAEPLMEDKIFGLVKLFRRIRNYTPFITLVRLGGLPPDARGFDGIDHFVLASNQLRGDHAGTRALRHWVEDGGTLWVMLDRIDPDVLPVLLGSAYDFQIVGRTSVTDYRIEKRVVGNNDRGLPQSFAEPVDLVQVLLPDETEAIRFVDGWPIRFKRRMGRGHVFFTTFGPRGWLGSRRDRNQRFPATEAFVEFAQEIPVRSTAATVRGKRLDAIAPILEEQIGYSVMSRWRVFGIFGIALLAAVGLGFLVRQTKRPELLGWLGPLAAVGAAVAFVVISDSSREGIPPTLAMTQIVDAVSGTEEAAVYGVLAGYRPEPGAAPLAARRGGAFDMAIDDTGGDIRNLIRKDIESWEWENVKLPYGVRHARFSKTLATPEPLGAVVSLGPEGLEGKVRAAPFTGLSDAVLVPASGQRLAIDLKEDGTFTATSADVLRGNRYLSSAVLSDRQQQRERMYQEFLTKLEPRYQGKNLLFVWAEPQDLGFEVVENAKLVGNALLVLPVEMRAPSTESSVTIPAPLIEVKRMIGNRRVGPKFSARQAVSQDLRFQLPRSVLPFAIEKVTLRMKFDAPSRRIAVTTLPEAGAQTGKKLYEAESPLDPIELEITEPSVLEVDERGGVSLRLVISKQLGRTEEEEMTGDAEDEWKMTMLELEVTGKSKEAE